ncbi:MAG: ATP-binding protein [bacterium]|nr:ATP-binding protein [bacterium]
MERDVYKWLKNWKNDKNRKPIIIRGARQVGKTWLVNHFGQANFDRLIDINFELQPQMKSCFATLDPMEILQRIELSLNVDIIPGKTLLFLDEIQEYPEAIKALRYFHEKLPALHVVAAGSLLEFVMEAESVSFPVGRVQNIHLFPLSFGEFLSACGEFKLRQWLRELSITDQIPESIHSKCVSRLRDYLYLGGMPETIAVWLETNNFSKTDEIHQLLLQNYKHDFGKYGRHVNFRLLEKVFTKAPATVGNKFKYAGIDRDVNARDIRKSLNLLIKAHILHKVTAASGSGLPLAAHCNEKFFKILFLDVGLLQSAMGIAREAYLSDNLLAVYKGLVTEQFTGQQLFALSKCFVEPELYYWQREKKGSAAEVDYLWQKGESILPIEVKAGKTGTLKSLRVYLSEKNAPFGIRFSLHPLSFTDSVLSIPLYAVEALPGLVEQIK